MFIVDKKILLEQVLSNRPNQIKIDGKVTKVELIRNLFEQTSKTKDFIELAKEQEEGIGTLEREEVESKGDSLEITAKATKQTPKKPETEKPEDKKSEEEPKKPEEEKSEEKEPSGERVQGTGLKFATDLGFKAVALNDEFRKINQPKIVALKNMFSPEELKQIATTPIDRWKRVTPKKFYCREKNVALSGETDTTVPCWRESEKDKIRMANQITKGYLNSYYTRMDEGGKEKRFKHPKSGEVWVPMGARSEDLDFRILELSPRKDAVAFALANQDDVFIAPLSPKKVDFLFDVDDKKKAPPKKAPKKTPEKDSKTKEPSDAQKKAGDLLIGLS